MRNHYENDFDLHENETACRTHFHMKGLTRRLVLKQRQKRTRKWSIDVLGSDIITLDRKKLYSTKKSENFETGTYGKEISLQSFEKNRKMLNS